VKDAVGIEMAKANAIIVQEFAQEGMRGTTNP
jgi:hypothetical protein